MYCPNCGTQLKEGVLFCSNCGAKQLSQPQAAAAVKKETVQVSKKGSKVTVHKGGLNKKAIIAAVLVIALVVTSIFTVPLLIKTLSGKDERDFAFYRKNGELYVHFLDEDISRKLTTDWNYDYFYYPIGSDDSYQTVYNEKTKCLFYPDKGNESGFSLYQIEINSKKAAETQSVKIDTNVKRFVVPQEGDKVYYLTSNGVLYSSDFENKTKLATDVDTFYLNESNGTVVYYTVEDKEDDQKAYGIYSVNSNGKTTEIATNLPQYPSSAFGFTATTFWRKGKTIYSITEGKDVKELFSVSDLKDGDRVQILSADLSKGLYYAIYRSESYMLKDFIEDNYAAGDAVMEEPDSYDQKYWKSWEEGWFSVYATEYTDQYYKDLDAYEEKLYRDEIREEIEDYSLSGISTTELYHFNGSESKKIADNVDWDYANHNGYLSYSVDDLEDKKVDIMDIYKNVETSYYSYDAWDISKYVRDIINPSETYYFAIDGTANKIVTIDKDDEANSLTYDSGIGLNVSEKDKKIYYCMELDEETMSGEMYQMKISGKNLGKAEKYCSDVVGFDIDENNNIISFRDPVLYNDDEYLTADLYINDKKVDTDVMPINMHYDSLSLKTNENSEILYWTSYSADDYTGTLRMYDGDESKTIANDTTFYSFYNTDAIMYIDDFDNDNYDGVLHYYIDGEDTVLADNVEGMVIPASY